MQYVLVLTVPDDDPVLEGDNSIEVIAHEVNMALELADSRATVQPLSEVIAS